MSALSASSCSVISEMKLLVLSTHSYEELQISNFCLTYFIRNNAKAEMAFCKICLSEQVTEYLELHDSPCHKRIVLCIEKCYIEKIGKVKQNLEH